MRAKGRVFNFLWFAVMFGAGLGVGLMVFATAEPLGLLGSNQATDAGQVKGNTPEGLQVGYHYTFLRYGLHACAMNDAYRLRRLSTDWVKICRFAPDCPWAVRV